MKNSERPDSQASYSSVAPSSPGHRSPLSAVPTLGTQRTSSPLRSRVGTHSSCAIPQSLL